MLSALLGCPVVPMVGHRNEGTEALLDAVGHVAREGPRPSPERIQYGREIAEEIDRIARKLVASEGLGHFKPQWVALKLLERDAEVIKTVKERLKEPGEALSTAERSIEHLTEIFGEDPEAVIADRRYGFATGAFRECVRISADERQSRSDLVDAIMCNRAIGLPIFFGLMYLVFYLTFAIGDAPMHWIEGLFGWLAGWVNVLWAEHSESILRSLLVDGIIAGVGGVVVFLPNIMLLFLAIAVLEDSGYMARAAFLIDRLMHKIGLHGKSFIPMLIGFGCSVPAIMGTRILDSRRDRMTTMLVVPLMSCGARLPIYSLIIPAFFAEDIRAPLLWSIYFIGIVLAVILIKVLRVTLFRGETAPFVMELPPYRMPTLKGLGVHMWERSWLYLKKAGTVILGMSILLWALTSYPKPSKEMLQQLPDEKARQEAKLTHSFAGRIGHLMEPAIRPLGFDWRIGTALIGALAAKEVFVAQLGIVYAVGNPHEGAETLRQKLRENYTPLTGFCIMLFCLITAPCVATIAATRKESGSWGWALFQLGGLTALAYVITLAAYQTGSFLGIGGG